jgi:hypothetical protein
MSNFVIFFFWSALQPVYGLGLLDHIPPVLSVLSLPSPSFDS